MFVFNPYLTDKGTAIKETAQPRTQKQVSAGTGNQVGPETLHWGHLHRIWGAPNSPPNLPTSGYEIMGNSSGYRNYKIIFTLFLRPKILFLFLKGLLLLTQWSTYTFEHLMVKYFWKSYIWNEQEASGLCILCSVLYSVLVSHGTLQ